MKIELWSDYACPFCYIGEKRLKKALAALKDGASVEVEIKSFELDATASREVVSSTTERFAKKYGLSREEAAARIEAISEMGRAEGINFRYAETQYTNTFDALRLTKYAQEKGKTEIVGKLFDAYFTKNEKLSDHEVLKGIAVSCGLDAKETAEVLAGDRYAAEVRDDERDAMRFGIHAVPYFLVNGKYAASGAQPVELLQELVEKAMAEEAAAPDATAGMACGPDGCRF